jgi:hypothetical protein
MKRPPPPLPKLPAIELDGFSLDIDYYLTKEYVDIGLAAVELPALIETLNWQNQANVEQLMRKEAERKRAEGEVYFRMKNGGFQSAGYGDKPTDKGLDYAVKLDPDVIALEDQVAILTAWTDRLKNLMKSLQSKLELVRSTEATRRKLPEQPGG